MNKMVVRWLSLTIGMASIIALIISLMPLVAFYGFYMGLIVFLLALYAFKRKKELGLPLNRIKQSMVYLLLAMGFGGLVYLSCKCSSSIKQIQPLEEKGEDLKNKLFKPKP